jgi:hypothetical protein
MQRSNMQRSNMQRSNMQRSNMQRSNMQRSNMQRSNMQRHSGVRQSKLPRPGRAFAALFLLLGLWCVNQPSTNADDASGSPTAKAESKQSGDAHQMLRHAVFFKFKESSSGANIQGVVDAFRGLPAKIDLISDFVWGTNNSEEGFDDGFTHCFLLSFHDDAGRAAYLPHPDHKVFGSVLRPHMDDVFVIDYWGTSRPGPDKQLKHAVFFKFKEEASAEEVKAIEEAFAALPQQIDTIKAFEWGINNSPEKHDDGFTHCFMVTFDSEEGRAKYLPHAAHKAFVEVLLPVLDKVRVLDFWAKK